MYAMGIYKIHVEPRAPQQSSNNYSFRCLVKNSILFGQCFAILPVDGVTLKESKLQFKWLTLRTVYTIVTGLLLLFYTLCVLVYTVVNSDNFFAFVVVVWNLRGVVGIALFFRVSQRWPGLVRYWKEIENSMYGYKPPIYMKLKFRILSAVYFFTGITEHILFIIGGIKKLNKVKHPSGDYVQKYYELLYSEFFYTFKYTHWKAVIIEFLSLVTTVQWQFTNYFITIISVALAERFQQITAKINSRQLQNEEHWRNVRQHYNNLTLLCKSVNEVIGELVVLAFSGNLYFLSISTLQCLSPRNGFEIAYYWYGFLFTIMHFLLLCWYTSWVYEESTESISELATPTRHLSHEIDRLLQQMGTRDIGISGCGLFLIKRNTILTIISTIVTIELIFIEFHTKLDSNI